ncbi:hypothetical protein M885DRAFT_553820 [Pelagophyceae sp. CCMP2097]|nr:hypothetical protein M885DRAFT_553820 [Pelagophyceae sp. CCMP2097]
MAWERDYMEACVVKLAPTPQDRVLEVGFGLGFSATAIAAGEPKRHTILECAPAVLRRAHAWAASRGNTDIVAETWQSYLAPREGAAAFDAVFFDDFPLQAQPRGESRWHTFLRAVEPRLAENARLTGYFANDGALADLPTGFAVESRAKFDVEPSEDCPYFSKEDEALLVILRYSRHPSSS